MEQEKLAKKDIPKAVWGYVWNESKKTFLIIAGLLLIALLVLVVHYAKSLPDKASELGRRMFGSKDKTALAVFPVTTTSQPMLDGLNINNPYLNKDKNWKLVHLREDGLEATEQDLLHRLGEDSNIVLVVGHERSTTVKYLNERVYESDRFIDEKLPIPLILPAVTNPDITKSSRGGHKHILRLPATDDKQVARLIGLLDALKAERVVLVVDTSNRGYSDYIARELIALESKSIIVDSLGVDISSNGFSSHRFLQASPDTIIFVGMEVEATIFLKRLRSEFKGTLGHEGLRLIFTDGVAGVTFDKSRTMILNDKDTIFLSGPFPAEAKKGDQTAFPTYKGYAALARIIVEDIFVRANRRGGLSRGNVLKVMQDIKDDKHKYNFGDTVVALFNETGDNTLGLMHVWDIRKNSAAHSEQCTCE